MSENKGILSSGLRIVGHNKRYILWFWLFNLTLAEFGTSAFRKSAHPILDHSIVADRLLHGFDVAVMALVVTYLSDPNKAVSEMVRVVRPGGWVATYVWDVPGAGTPVHPIYVAMESLGMPAPRPPGPPRAPPRRGAARWRRSGPSGRRRRRAAGLAAGAAR